MAARFATCFALTLLLVGCSHSDVPFSGGGSTRPTATKSPGLCTTGPRTELFVALDTMPRGLTNTFLGKLAEQTSEGLKLIVDRDQRFQATEKPDDPPTSLRRFIQGGHLGNTWIILYEKGGGTTLQVHAVAYDFPDRNTAPTVKAHVETTVKTMCDTAEDLLTQPNEPHEILADW